MRKTTKTTKAWKFMRGRPTSATTSFLSIKVEVTIQLKYFCNFWRYLDLPLMKCEVKPDLLKKLCFDRTL